MNAPNPIAMPELARNRTQSVYTDTVWRIVILLTVLPMISVETKPATLKTDLVFLTRDGCVNTPDMLNNVDDALRGLKLPLDYHVINIGTLPKTDPRTGYPTPTVLWKG